MAADNIELQKISEFVTQLVRITQIDGAVVYGVDRNGNSVKIETSQLRTDLSEVNSRLTNVENKAETNRSNISTLQTTVQGKANAVHTHSINDVTNLSNELAAKATTAQVTELNQQIAAVESSLDGKSDVGHTHAISDVTNLQTVLDGKANTVHTHAISDVTNLQTALDSKSNVGHTHALTDVNGITEALDGKSDVGHTHTMADITDLSDALDPINSNVTALGGRVDTVEGQVSDLAEDLSNIGMSDINGLQEALDGKAETVHVHQIGDVTDLQNALDEKVGAEDLEDVTDQVTTLSGNVQGLSDQVIDLRAAIDNIQVEGGLPQVQTFDGYAASDGDIVEYVGATNETYTNGWFYQYSATTGEWTRKAVDQPVEVQYDSEVEQLTFYNVVTI